MLPPADPIGTRPLRGVEPVTTVNTLGDPRREVFNRLTQIALGKMFQAEVLSRFDDGTHLVRIDNAALKAALPGNPQVGDFLSLKFVAAQPRPTFLLLPRSGTDTASLSSAARLIGNILDATAQDAEALALTAKAPILTAGSADAPAIAFALKHTLAMSGLFYESHLHQWAAGTRSLADLQQEPQAKAALPNILHPAPTARTDAGLAAQLINIVSDWDGAMATSEHPGSSAPSSALERLNSDSMHLINLQLQAIEHNKILWHGELWPGQAFEWEVSEDKPHAQGEEDGSGESSSWTSVVRFSLPTLGVVCASICLSKGRVQMQLHAASEQTASLLHQHSAELANALDAAGSPLEAFAVKQDEQV
ncbi:flagellar hook-length control protein FliK [Oxalobacteraceae bacterium R-40]|uniref:Flagellar hook-length control protein FliK n=1 Tax=Keguizhuia sedimenti TaxID=3064264 RepID=A0ABU1BR91_9BURK|nr:flagellar hook-length control protein FliK [Oxalobacteraceae bacterium R-40]